METLVLIPEEFVLCVGRGGAVEVWSDSCIPSGSTFYPFGGVLRLWSIPIDSPLPPLGVRLRLGAHEAVEETSPGVLARFCNWVRFLKSEEDEEGDEEHSLDGRRDANIEARFIGSEGGTEFRLIRDVARGVRMVMRLPRCLGGEADTLEGICLWRHHSFYRISRSTDCPSKNRERETTNHGIFSSHGDPPLDLSKKRPSNATEKVLPCKVQSKCYEGSKERCQVEPSRDGLKAIAVSAAISPDSTSQCGGRPNAAKNSKVRSYPNKRAMVLPCDVCGKQFDRPSLLKRHHRTHTGEKPHGCQTCGKCFSTSSSLNTHRRIHSGERPHSCFVCGKRFTASSNLYYHRMTHTKDKPHKCSICGKSFPTPGDLRSHTYVHTGCWPFRCPLCNRGFSKTTNLRNHLFLHTGDKPHQCTACGKRFALSCNLRAHSRTHAEATGRRREEAPPPEGATREIGRPDAISATNDGGTALAIANFVDARGGPDTLASTSGLAPRPPMPRDASLRSRSASTADLSPAACGLRILPDGLLWLPQSAESPIFRERTDGDPRSASWPPFPGSADRKCRRFADVPGGDIPSLWMSGRHVQIHPPGILEDGGREG